MVAAVPTLQMNQLNNTQTNYGRQFTITAIRGLDFIKLHTLNDYMTYHVSLHPRNVNNELILNDYYLF